MDDSDQPLMLNQQPRPAGTVRATLALVVSLAALGFSIYGLASRVFDDSHPFMSPPAVNLEPLEARLQALEDRQGRFAEDIGKVTAQLEQVGKTPLASVPEAANDTAKNSVEDLHRQLDTLGKDSAALKTEIDAALVQKAQFLSNFSLIQSLRNQLQNGFSFSDSYKRLASGDGLKALDDIKQPESVSDRALHDDLQSLAPQFTTLQNMGKAQGFFQKLSVRMQNLVTIRPKDGLAGDGSETGKMLAALDKALETHDWKSALAFADTLQPKSPPEFSAWHDRLKTRMAAETVLDNLETSALQAMTNNADAASSSKKSTTQPDKPDNEDQ